MEFYDFHNVLDSRMELQDFHDLQKLLCGILGSHDFHDARFEFHNFLDFRHSNL